MKTKSDWTPKKPEVWASTMIVLFSALFIVAGCQTTTPPPEPTTSSSAMVEEGVPGGIFVDTIEIKAKVTAVDTAKRKVTLMGPDGDEFTTKVGPEAINFDQVKKGDMVNVVLTKELVVFLDADGTSAPDGTVALMARAKKGEKPAGVIAATSQVTATVRSIDRTARTATLMTEDGTIATFPVRDDIDLTKHKVGEKVVFQVTEMIAISVEKQ